MRLASVKAAAYQRSINMAISHRGIAALHAVHPDCVDQFLLHAIPMRGRMIHKPNGQLDSQQYDRDGQVGSNSYSVSFSQLCSTSTP